MAPARLENEGFALRGRFTAPDAPKSTAPGGCWPASTPTPGSAQRREIEPVTARDFMRFLLRWQHVTPDTQLEGSLGVLAVIEQLQGFELAAGRVGEAILAGPGDGYRREWLDEACCTASVAWGRLSVRDSEPDAAPRRSGLTPSRATPITLTIRDDLPWLLARPAATGGPPSPVLARTEDVLDVLRQRGALFRSRPGQPDRAAADEVEEALWDGVARGLVTADGFRAVRSLLARRVAAQATGRRRVRARRASRRVAARLTARAAGRWSLLPEPAADCDPDELAEAVAEQLLARWGVVFRDLMTRENLAVRWRELLWAMRRMEARGHDQRRPVRAGFSGEQFAQPEAVEPLRSVRK